MASEVEELQAKAEQLAQVASPRPEAERAARLAERLARRRFLVSFVGEFKRGKSTLINALVGAEVLPTGVLPLTSVATEVSYGERAAVVEQLDGARQEIDPADVGDYVTEERNPRNERAVARVEVRGSWPLLEPGVVLVDTPGIGSVYLHNTDAARAALIDADGAVLVLSADAPLSERERDLLRSLAERRAPTFFVLNKADHLAAGELDQVRRFVEDIVCDELGRKRRVFAVSARADDGVAHRGTGPIHSGHDAPFTRVSRRTGSIDESIISAARRSTTGPGGLLEVGDPVAQPWTAISMNWWRARRWARGASPKQPNLDQAMDAAPDRSARRHSSDVRATRERNGASATQRRRGPLTSARICNNGKVLTDRIVEVRSTARCAST